ncbi:WD40 repeat domain-containing protein [Roseovarius sp. D22-M7]|uniref:WD40 repeat domain-containing protein n=1 Tax=Roseovarius sp. D22-M7 TaxID=3127116 RepID=UPI003010424A
MIAMSTFCLSALVAFPQTGAAQSRDAAQNAIDRLARGDRIGAIATALQAIPDDSSLAGAELIEATWRAVHSRSIVVDDNRPYTAAVDPSGTRMLLASAEGFTGDLASHAPASLVDLSTDTLLGQAIPAPEIDSEMMQRQSHSIGFSPDGRFASIMMMSRNAVILLDARDGQRHALLEAPGPDFGMTTLIFPVGFSPDSTRFAAGGPLGLFFWDTTSGELVNQFTFPPASDGTMVMPMAWGPNEEIYGVRGDQQNEAELIVIENGTVRVMNTGLSAASYRLHISPDGKVLAIDNHASTELFDTEGNPLASLPPSRTGRFVRGGTAYAVYNLQEMGTTAAATLRVFTLNGQELDPQPSDYGGFDHHVFSPEGKILGSSIWGTPVTYVGQAMNNAQELTDLARSLVPQGYILETTAASTASDSATPDPILMSRQFAFAADAALGTGGRAGAIVAALKGLPGDPTQSDFEMFEDAHLMLFRAVAARTLRTALDFPAGAVVDPTGQRMAVAAYQPGLKPGPVFLLDTRDGNRVADLTLPDGPAVLVHPSNHTPNYAPDGTILAIMPSVGGQMHLFNGQTGAYIRPLVLPGAAYTPFYGFADIGFSSDGQSYAAVSDGSLYIFEVSTGNLLLQRTLPSRYGFVPVGWGSRGGLFFSSIPTVENATAQILRFENGSFQKHFDIFDASGRPANSVLISGPFSICVGWRAHRGLSGRYILCVR